MGRRNVPYAPYNTYGFYLPADVVAALEAEAEASGQTVSAVARKYVRAGLQHVRALPSLDTTVDTGTLASTSVPGSEKPGTPPHCGRSNDHQMDSSSQLLGLSNVDG